MVDILYIAVITPFILGVLRQYNNSHPVHRIYQALGYEIKFGLYL